MKRLVYILVLACLVAACTSSVETRFIASQNQQLQVVDSLMWQQPDSALMVLVDFAASPKADSLSTFDGHYCQLLFSELLYKNYYEQSNREKLLKAVDYFDSLTTILNGNPQPRSRHCGGPQSPGQNDNLVFLDARAHSINGVGFYERDSLVEACTEYLKALKVMESHFEEKDLLKNKAKFMAYTYNRLGDMFSEQFMMEAAVTCYENALVYCKIESTSSIGISNILYRIGKQYDKMNEIDKARQYFGQALEYMPNTNNIVYRDLVSSKAVTDYQYGVEIAQILEELRRIIPQCDNETERLLRFMTIGTLFYEEGNYDSSLYYLIPVFENSDNRLSQMQAAEYLRNVYDSIGEFGKEDVCVRFLADHKKSEGENKALVSKLEDLFRAYMNQKQKKEAEEAREKSIRETIEIVVFITSLFILAILVLAKQKSKQLLKKQQDETDRVLEETEQEHEKELRLWQAVADKTLEETEKKHEKELETERLSYQKKQEVLQQNLLEKEAHVNVLKKALNQQHEEAEQRRMDFLKEPICEAILNKAKSKQITTRDVAHELGIALKDEDLERLGEAVAKYYDGFDHVLLSQCPNLKHGYLALCHLNLLGLSESEIAALKNVSYSAIRKQNESLQEKLGVDETISAYVLMIAEGLCGTLNDEPEEPLDMDIQRTIEENSGQPMEMEQESSLKSSLKSSQKIQELISASPNITISEIADRLGMTKRGVDKNIKRLKEQGIIRRVGPDRGGHWEVIESL